MTTLTPVRNRSLVLGMVLVALVVLAALVSFVWTPYDPVQVNAADKLLGFSAEHLFGTDKFGRDVFSQIMVGARTTLYVGVVAVGIAAVIGTPLGVLAGLAPRWLGEFVMRVNDLVLAFPALLLAIFFWMAAPFLLSHEVGRLYERRGKGRPVSALTGLWFFPGALLLVGPIIWFVLTNRALNAYWRSFGPR